MVVEGVPFLLLLRQLLLLPRKFHLENRLCLCYHHRLLSVAFLRVAVLLPSLVGVVLIFELARSRMEVPL